MEVSFSIASIWHPSPPRAGEGLGTLLPAGIGFVKFGDDVRIIEVLARTPGVARIQISRLHVLWVCGYFLAKLVVFRIRFEIDITILQFLRQGRWALYAIGAGSSVSWHSRCFGGSC